MKFSLKRKPEPRDWFNIVVLLLLAALMIFLGISYTQVFGMFDSKDIAGSAEQMRALIETYGNAGIFSLVLLHAVQVIVSFIPAFAVQFGGGMLFGMTAGMLASIVGIFIGTFVTFNLSRHLGKRIVTLFVSEKNIAKLENLITSNMSSLVLFVLYTLPTPKDFFAYFVGLTNMKASRFFIIATLGRLPGMLIVTYLGAHVFDRNYLLIGILAAASFTLFLVLMLFSNRIIKALTRKR